MYSRQAGNTPACRLCFRLLLRQFTCLTAGAVHATNVTYAVQLILCTLAAYAFARYQFFGSEFAFTLVLVQLMITPEILIVENYGTLAKLDLIDTILGIGLPYMASAFGIFLLRQAFKSTPKEREDAARLEGCGVLGVLWRVYVPLARPTYLTYGLVSIPHIS